MAARPMAYSSVFAREAEAEPEPEAVAAAIAGLAD